MSTITYHLAGMNDIDELSNGRILFSLELSGSQPESAIEDLRQHFHAYFKKAISDKSCIAYIAKSGDKMAGMGVLVIREQPGGFRNPSGKVGYVMSMYTAEEFRKQGICDTLLNKLLEKGLEMGIIAYELQATPAGEKIYQRNQFLKHDQPLYRKYY